MNSFITGSRKYGAPTKDSDVDLVIEVSETDFDILALNATEVAEYGRYGGARHLRYGNLNIICPPTPRQLAAWRLGTDNLVKRTVDEGRRMSRDEARDHFKALGVN